MQKEYKKIYFDLTRYNLLPNNCMPLSKGNSKHQLNKLREINNSILDIIDPQTSAYFHNKRHSQANVVKVQKEIQKNRSHSKRIHDNVGQLKSTKYLTLEGILSNQPQKGSKKKLRLQKAFQSANNTIIQKRKDLYDVHIENYMSTKYKSEEVIDNYLNNRQQFIKKACQEIENELKQHSGSKKKQASKIKLKQYQSKLPKLQEFSNRMLEKPTHRSRDGSFEKQLTHVTMELLRYKKLLSFKQRIEKETKECLEKKYILYR